MAADNTCSVRSVLTPALDKAVITSAKVPEPALKEAAVSSTVFGLFSTPTVRPDNGGELSLISTSSAVIPSSKAVTVRLAID